MRKRLLSDYESGTSASAWGNPGRGDIANPEQWNLRQRVGQPWASRRSA